MATTKIREPGTGVFNAYADLWRSHIEWKDGGLLTVIFTCIITSEILWYWATQGIIDFSTTLAIGGIQTQQGFLARLIAYILLVPVFVTLQFGYYLIFHREAVLNGACPRTEKVFNLDWFSAGVIATAFPMAMQDIGPWITMTGIQLFGIFILPRFLDDDWNKNAVRAATVGFSIVLFIYLNYAGVIGLPRPDALLGPLATARLSDSTVTTLARLFNGLLTGPFVVAAFTLFTGRVMTRDEVAAIPRIGPKLQPEKTPGSIIFASAAVGTAFFLTFHAFYTGNLMFGPELIDQWVRQTIL